MWNHRIVVRSVYSWMSRSFCTLRPASERKIHCAPTDALESVHGNNVVRGDSDDLRVPGNEVGTLGGQLRVLLVNLRTEVAS